MHRIRLIESLVDQTLITQSHCLVFSITWDMELKVPDEANLISAAASCDHCFVSQPRFLLLLTTISNLENNVKNN